MTKNNMNQLCQTLAGAPVLVVGDIMLDRFIYGHVERISPESPVPVLTRDREDMMLGGAGNALANLAGLGAKGMVLSVIGADQDGETLKSLVEQMGCGTDGLIVQPERPTSVKTRFLAGHQQLLRTDFEERAPVDDETAKSILEKAKRALKQVKVLLISDYGKGLLRPDVIGQLIAEANAQGVAVIVDPKGQDFSIYRGANVITPNRKELSDATKGAATKTDADVEAACQSVIDECGIDAVVATRSADGMSVISRAEEPFHIRSIDIEVFDVSGAGDTVISTIAASLAAGAPLNEAAQLANIAGSIVVTKVGTAPIRFKELENAIQDGGGPKHAGLCDLGEAKEQIKRWKAKGLKVGFTNGCFDIVHAGHVTYLAETKKHCDRLVLALNSDSSVRILKGPERPIHDEVSRAAVMSALASVDMVVLFGAQKEGDDNTACALLETLKPDVYFKGGDYTVDQIPEAPGVMAYGGEVRVLFEVKGQSTTNAVNKIKGKAA